MDKHFSRGILMLSLVWLLPAACRQPDSREPAFPSWDYFDTTADPEDSLVLTAMSPSPGRVQALAAMMESGMLPSPSLIVVGVFHEQEHTDYRRAAVLAAENGYDWIRFHRLSDPIHRDEVFRQNRLSDDFRRIFAKSDGMLFLGGEDLPPYLYGENTGLLTVIRTHVRHYVELSFLFHLLGGYQDEAVVPILESAPDFPVLGICLGMQTMNVSTGGALIQDIPSEVYGIRTWEQALSLPRESWHVNPASRLYPEERLFSSSLHPIRFTADGAFAREFGFSPDESPYVVSAHHQAVESLGKGLRVIATSLDGKIIEAVDHVIYPHVLGVQFHPESRSLWSSEIRLKVVPEDFEAVNARELLEKNPPSEDFHRRLWAWFVDRVQEFHDRKRRE